MKKLWSLILCVLLLAGFVPVWDEAVENYMDGYAWWSGTDLANPGSEYQKRLKIYERLKDDPALFNPSLWEDEFVLH